MADPAVAGVQPGGALSGGFVPGYMPAGSPPLTAAAGQPGMDFASLVQRYGPEQAAAMAPTLGIAVDPTYTNMLAKQSQDIMGGGPLSQQVQTLQTNEQKAAQAKKDAINQAISVLKVNQAGQTTNLPLLAAGAAMLAPTRTGAFTESLSNAIDASLPQVQQQRQRELDQAKLQGSLGVDAADVDLSAAQEQSKDFYTRLGISENDLKYAAASGARMQANVNSNTTRLTTNQNTVDAKDRATDATAAFRSALTSLNGQKLSETQRHNEAMESVRQQLVDQGGGNIAEKDWNDYQSRVTGNMNAISKTMPGMNLDPDTLRAKAIEMTVPPPISGKNPTPKAASAPAQRPAPAQSAPATKPSLDDIFATQPTQ